ncbi:MAG TPA: HAD-IB family phosphatase [Mycobacterium sp.]
MTKLHIFDMDGTLLRSTASLEISKSAGAHEQALAIEQGWLAGEISDVGFWERCLPLWEGIDDAQIDEAFRAAPWMEGVAEVFADIAARAEHSVVITQSPQFFVDRLLAWGAENTYGTRVAPGFGVSQRQLISAEDKVAIVVDLLGRYGLRESSCIAYGDSTSDIPLFEWLPHTVAINASARVKGLARTAYDGNDLRGAYSAARNMLATPVGQIGQSQPRPASTCNGQR